MAFANGPEGMDESAELLARAQQLRDEIQGAERRAAEAAVALEQERERSALLRRELGEMQSSSVSVSIRWPLDELNTIKQAAEQANIRYQAYIRQAALRRAVAELAPGKDFGKLVSKEDVFDSEAPA
jgi:predicted DNA binding CopG/RHH family protein